MVNGPPLRPAVRTAIRIWQHPANAGHRGRRLALWLSWQLWERTVRRPWLVDMPPGLSVELVPHDPVSSGVLYCALPDWPEMPFLLDYLRPGEVMIDVGANVGLYCLLAAGGAAARVVAFEPDDDARGRAAANLARNNLLSEVELRPEAVGAAPGPGALTKGRGPMNRLVDRASAVGHRPVDVVTLDGAVGGPVAMVKVDVEGHEPAVLDGARQVLAVHRPALILEANDPEALSGRLEPLGYRWIRYDPQRRRAEPVPAPAPGGNGIAVADLAAANERLAAAPRR